MSKHWIVVICVLASALLVSGVFAAITANETEPNDTTASANPLNAAELMEAAINPAADVDYFTVGGSNSTWGFIALLETVSSTTSTDGVLTAFGQDGVTVLQTDYNSWERGAGIALQNFVDGTGTYYLRVNEQDDNAVIDPYRLRYFKTVVATQPEVEPNETRLTATTSSFTQAGTISADGDVDCFAVHGRVGDDVILALNGDPEKDGSPVDLVLELFAPNNELLDSANHTATGGSEFIEIVNLAEEGLYAYCVRRAAGTGGATATYTAGLVRNGGLYFPQYEVFATWLNPPPGGAALVGDTLTFRLTISNTSPVNIPGNIRITSSYDPACLSLLNTQPMSTTASAGYVSWDGQKDGLAAGEVYSVTMSLEALALCSGVINQDTGVAYFFTGHGDDVAYLIARRVFLPLVLRNP